MANIQDLINQARQSAQERATQIKQQSQQNQAAEQNRREQQRQKAIAAREEYYNRRNENLRNEFGFDTLEQDAGNQEQKLKRLYDNYRNGNYISDSEFEDVLNSNKDMESRLGKYKDYLSLNRQDTSSVDGTIKNYKEIARELNSLRSYMSQFSNPEEYTTNWDNVTYGEKYKGTSLADIDKAIGSTTGREQAWLTNHRYDYATSDDIQRELDALNENRARPLSETLGVLYPFLKIGGLNEKIGSAAPKVIDRGANVASDALNIANWLVNLNPFRAAARSLGVNYDVEKDILNSVENSKLVRDGKLRTNLEALRDAAKRGEKTKEYEKLAAGETNTADYSSPLTNDPLYKSAKKELDKPSFSKKDGDLFKYFDRLRRQEEELGALPRAAGNQIPMLHGLEDIYNDYKSMTQEERNILLSLNERYGSQAAVNYLSSLKVELDRRQDNELKTSIQKLSDDMPAWARVALFDVAGSAMTVPQNLVSGVLALGNDLFDRAVGNDFDPYNLGHASQNVTQYMRNQVSDNIAKATGSDKVLPELYQAGMSGLDSMFGGYTLGPVYLATMGIGAAESQAKKAYEEGRSNESIAVSAMMAGLAEVITEKLGYERMMRWLDGVPKATFGEFIKSVLKQIVPEAAEEITSDVINDVTDAFVNAGDTNFDREVKKIMEEQGVDEETAKSIAFKDKAVEYLWSGIGGAVASFVPAMFGGVASVQTSRYGEGIIDGGLLNDVLDRTADLKAADLQLPGIPFESGKSATERQNEAFDEIKQTRQRILDALDNGENPNPGDVGNLASLAGIRYTNLDAAKAKASDTYKPYVGSLNNRVKRKTINDIGSMAGLSNNQFKYEIKKNGFKNRFNAVIGVNLDTEGLSLVDKMNIVKAASETADSIRSDEATAQIAESLDKDPSYQNRKKIIDAVNRNKIAPITEQQKDLDRNSKEYLALEAQKNVYKILCDDVRSRGKSGATAFFEANGKDVAEDRSLQALPGYGKLTPKAKETIDALGKVTYQSLGDIKVSGKNNQAAVQEMRSELAARNQLERDEDARITESARREASEKYRKNLTKFSDQAKSVFKKYGIDLNVSHKGERDTYRITLSDGSVIENENRAEATNPREWARNAVGIITLFDDIDAGRVTPINYLNGRPLDGRTAEFLAGHEGAHFAIAKDVNLIGRTIESLKGTSLDIYGLNDANVRFNESTGKYELDISALNDKGQSYFEQMRKNLLEHNSRPSDHDILEEIVCDMYGSVIASDSFTRTLAEGTRLGNLVRRAIDRFAKTRLGMKIIKPGKKASQVNEAFDKAEEWVKKFDAIRERAEKFAPKRSGNDAQKTSSSIEALLSDLKRDGIKTDLSALDEKYLKRLISAEDKIAEAQKILAELGENAGAARPALENLIKEKPRTGSTESRLDEQMNAIVENAPRQRRKNKAAEEAKTLAEAQVKALEAFESEPSLDTEPMDESVEPIDTNEIKEVVGADPKTIVDIPKNSMSTMFEGCGFDIPAPRFDENGTLQNDPLTITYQGKAISRDEMTGEFIRSTDSPVMTLLNSSLGKGLMTQDQIAKVTDDFAGILKAAMQFGDTGGGVSAIDSIWRWAVKDNAFKPVKSNSDKQYKRSIDFLTICKKTEELLGTVSQYQVENKHGMTPAEVMKAYYETGKAGFQTPCPLCYVFSRWIDNGKTQQTQYTAQQYYGDTSKSGLKYRALNAEEFAQLSDEEKDDYIKVWNKEQKRQKAWAEKNKTAIDAARKDVQEIFTEFDRLFAEKEKGADVDDMLSALNERYIAAANLLAYSDFGGWITYNVLQFKTEDGETVYPKKYSDTLNVTKKSGNRMVNHGNAVPVYKEVPADILFDYFRIAECYENRYDGFLRYKSSKGSEAGKGVETETNNAFGSVIAGLATNPQSVKEAKNTLLPIFEKGISEKERAKRTKAFENQFDTAIKNARRQSLIGGQRFFSWSDNRVEYGPDMFSAFVQLQTLGCSVQSYTKQLEGLNLISRMGGYVNGSLIAKGMGYKNGKLVYSDRQGINHTETFKLNKLNDKAGNILVGMNDEHILIGLADDEVFFIIPYHQSGLKKEFLLLMMDMLNEPYVDSNGNKISVDEAATDYTDVQEEKIPGVLSGAAEDKDGNEISYEIDSYLSDFWTKISDALDKESKNSDYDFSFLNENRISHGDGALSEEQMEYRRLRARTILNQLEDGDLEKVQADPFLSQIYRKINETYDTPVSMTSDEVNAIYPYEYWDENTTYDTANVNGMRYLEYCRRLGIQPKFSGLLNSADPNHRNFALRDGNFVDGYWKLLIDRRMYRNVYDADGNWVSYNGEYQGTDSVTADNFSLDLILPEKINERFEVTRSADKSTFKEIARKTRESLENQGYDVDRFYIETGSQEEALKNYADETDTKYSVSTDTDGNKYVIVDENAIDVSDGRSVATNIAKVLKDRFNNLVKANGQFIRVNRTTNGEFRASNWAKALYTANREWYDDKLKSLANSDEVLKTAKEWVNEDIKHARKDNITSFGRAKVLYKVKDNGYEADVLVGINKDGSAVLYDIIKINAKKIIDAGSVGKQSLPSGANASIANNYTTNSSESQEVNAKKSPADNYQPLTEEQTEWGRLNNENKEVGSPLYNMSGNLQGRWKNSVGKEAGGIYVHKDYAREVAAKLFGNLDTLRTAEQIAKEKGIDYTCVMLDKSKPSVVRLDESPNFDTADEPIPGNTYTVNVTDGTVKEGFSDRIWHHKWMWVKNDYKGFDVEDSWNRSKEYLNRIRKLDAPKGSLEYEMSHNGTANGSARGYDKWNEQLEYFGIEPKHSMSVEDERYLKDMYGLDEFKLATPTAGWKQTLLKNDAEKIMPDLWKKTEQKIENNEKAGRDPTQRPITVSSYRNVFAKLKEEGFSGTILDASSGLGLGTKAGREEPFNFDVDDVELYPEESYKPRYRSYADIKKKYDVIISNAVLNVLPQDYRDALVTKMGQLLNGGGRMFINVRSTDVNNVDKDRNINTGENEWLIPKDGSYQKGFLKSELVAYLKDALGDGFTVIPYNGFRGGTWALVTKNDKIKASPAITATNESGRQSAGNALNANNYTTNSSKSQEANNKKVGQSRTLDTSATNNNYTTNSSESQEVSGKNSSSVTPEEETKYLELAKEPEKNAKRLTEMVENAARAAGYTTVAYHGTSADFNVFSVDKIGMGFWFSEDKDYAGSHGKNTKKCFLNLGNPLNIETTDGDDAFSEIIRSTYGTQRWDEKRILSARTKNALRSAGYNSFMFLHDDSYTYIVFDSNQIKSADPVTYDEDGNVIPLSKRFEESNDDIRRSSSVELLNPDSDEIRNISRMVDEARDRLKKASQRTPTGETASTSEYIRNVITNVIDNTQTGMTYDQIRDRLAEIYRYVYFKSEKKNGKFSTVPFSINKAWDNLYSLANDIVSSAFEPAFTEDETAMFKDIYKRIRANALFKPAPGKHFAKATGVSIEDLIRNSPQKAKDSLNELYESLARDYPGIFPIKAEDIFDRYNQLRETAKQMNDSAKAKVQWAENHQNELDGIVAATALQLAGAIDKSYDEKALPRFAKKLNTLINRYEDDIEKLRDRILSITSNDRRKDDRAKAFRRLAITARTLGRPTRARHFNENLKPIAKALLESVVPKLPHRTKGETELYNTLNGLVRYSKTTDVNDYKDEFTQPIDDLKDAVDRFVQDSKQYNSFDELSDKMYSDLSKLLYRLAHLSNVMNKSLYFDKGYRELSTQAAAEIRATRKAVTNSAPQKVIQWLESAALDPVSGFNVIGSDTLMECFKNIVRGQNDFTKTLNGWIIQMKDIVGDKVKPDWHNQADEYVFSQGKLKLTKGELMYLYLLAQQEDSWTCLTGSGAKPVVTDSLVERLGKGASSLVKDTAGEVKNKLSAFSKAKDNVKYEMKKNFGKTIAHQNPVRFSEGDKMRIRSYLGTEAVEMCDRISLLLNGDVAKAGNEVSRKMEGYEKFNIAHYVPMIVDRNGNYEESTKNLGVYLAQPGFTKERDGRSKVLVLDDLFNVVEKHLLGMAQYSAFNEATADLVRIYANKYKGGSVAGVVNESFANGSPAKKFMENFITDIQGQQMNANIEPLAIERYLARYKKAAVAANLSTVAKQPTAIVRAFPEFSMKDVRKMHIGKGLIKSVTDRDIAEMCEHSGLAMMKSWGFSENASPKSLRQLYDVNEAKRAENVFNNAVSWGAEKADMITWAAIWRAAKFATMKDGKEDLAAATEKFNDVIVKTQVVNTATTTTRIAYQEGLAKLYFAFKNEPLKTFNYMRTSLVNFARNKDAESFGKMLRVMACAGLNSAVTAFITAAFSMLRDEEDDTDELIAKFIAKWEASALEDLIENVTIFTTDVIQAIKDATSPYGSTNISTAAVTDTVKSFYALLKDGSKPQNERTKTWYHHIYNLAKGLSELTGIPLRTFMRSVKSVCYATVNMKGDPYLKYLVTKAFYNANGYDSADAKTQFKAILTDALNHQDWEGYAKVRKKLQYHGYSSTDFDSAIKLSDVFVNAYNEGNLSKILKEARKYDDSLTEEKILKLIKSSNTSEITNLFNEMKAHGESSEYRKLKKELLGKKNPETGKNYTEKEIEKLIEEKVKSTLKSDLKKRLAGMSPTDPIWEEVIRKLAREYSRLGVTEDDVRRIARGL